MRLYLINPSNPLVAITQVKENRWNRFRVWKPLSLMVLAGLIPPEWEISILDENLGVPDYTAMPRPDLVGITAFTSQANRAYEVLHHFRRLGVLVVDDNLIGARREHIARAKDLFHAMPLANLRKQWVAQASINFADDEELLSLAAKPGCIGVFIGFETPTPEELRELGKKFNHLKARDFCACVRRIQRHGILVAGFFIIGLDTDEPGIGQRVAEVASQYVVDNLNALFLTSLPGTRLWDQMKSEDRIALDAFQEDWRYYALTFLAARYKHLSLDGIIDEMISCDRNFYAMLRILRRVCSSLWQRRKPLISLVGNFSYRNNLRLNRKAYADFKSYVKDGV